MLLLLLLLLDHMIAACDSYCFAIFFLSSFFSVSIKRA
jgi:hypothetical protein